MTTSDRSQKVRFSVPVYFEHLQALMNRLDLAEVEAAIELIRSAGQEKRKILVCGNGGSALTASHYINDWNKMAFLSTGTPFRGTCLSDNMGLMTAYSNDISYDDVYSEQLKNLMDPGDLVIAVSGSGNSENVVRALEYANGAGGVTLAISGYDGGKIKQLAQHSLWVPSFDMQLCEDLHFIFGHMVMKSLCGDSIHA
ncbi:MAG: SIS domain-containing protein [Myxococcota bacterium]